MRQIVFAAYLASQLLLRQADLVVLSPQTDLPVYSASQVLPPGRSTSLFSIAGTTVRPIDQCIQHRRYCRQADRPVHSALQVLPSGRSTSLFSIASTAVRPIDQSIQHCRYCRHNSCTSLFSIEELRCVILLDFSPLCKIEELMFANALFSRVVHIFRHE